MPPPAVGTPTDAATPLPDNSGRGGLLAVASVLLLVLLGAGLAVVLWWRRRHADENSAEPIRDPGPRPVARDPFWTPAGSTPVVDPAASADAASSEPTDSAPPPEQAAEAIPPRFLEPASTAAPRAWLAIAVDVRRAGLNLLTATVEVEVTLTNVGDASATDVRLGATLVNARQVDGAALEQSFDAPAGRPAVPPFALAPGAERRARVVATLPRDAIDPVMLGGREAFIPMLLLDVRYAGEGQTAAAMVVGVAREGADKLAPLWLDQSARMRDNMAARVHGTPRQR